MPWVADKASKTFAKREPVWVKDKAGRLIKSRNVFDVYEVSSIVGPRGLEWKVVASGLTSIESALMVQDINDGRRKREFPFRIERVKRPWGKRGHDWRVWIWRDDLGKETTNGQLYGYQKAWRLSKMAAIALSKLREGRSIHPINEKHLEECGFSVLSIKLTAHETSKNYDEQLQIESSTQEPAMPVNGGE